MSETEFSGVAYAPGEVRGARSFDVDKLGRLTGVTYRKVWKPGENQAECLADDEQYMRALRAHTYTLLAPLPSAGIFSRKHPAPPAPAEIVPEVAPHTFERCRCGFYGYYDGSNDYGDKGRVSGVIEGYGETLIGTRGFRCMKARIVALRIPNHVDQRLARMVERNYEGIPLFGSFKQMVAEFPPDDAGVGSTPVSDPDFWTRSI